MKTCYYELLGVEQDATDQELKKAYRKKALQLHPDKNPDDVEAATANFALVRSAYEILSDPQERSWYDSHRTQILNDDEDSIIDSYDLAIPSISIEELMRYFNPALYGSIDDSQSGFFKMVERVFERLASEEVAHGKSQSLKDFEHYLDDASNVNAIDESLLLFPRFGNSKCDYATSVRNFYNTWSSFGTVKSFSWKDEYRYAAAPDRRTRRLMEKENKKLRDQSRKEYNETVRSFVQFIKKRDPRVSKGIQDFEAMKKRKRNEEIERHIEQSKRDELKNIAMLNNYKAQDWEELSQDELKEIEEMLKEEYMSSTDSEFEEFEIPEEEQYLYECFVCNKNFKNEKQFKIHEDSKKHKKILKKVQWEMRREGLELGLDIENGEIDDDESFETAPSDIDDDTDSFSDIGSESDPASTQESTKILKSAIKVKSNISNDNNIETSEHHSKDLEYEVDDNIESESEMVTSGIQSSQEKLPANYNDTLNSDKPKELEKDLNKLVDGLKLDDSDDDWSNTRNKKSKKGKKKKQKGTESHVPNSKIESNDANIISESDSPSVEVCQVCSEKFDSRNKLFKHVKSSGHASPRYEVNSKKGGKKKRK